MSSASDFDCFIEEKGQTPEKAEKERLRRLFKGEIDLFLMRLYNDRKHQEMEDIGTPIMTYDKFNGKP